MIERLWELSSVYRLWQLPFERQKFAPVSHALSNLDVQSVLDVGCGPGTNAAYFKDSRTWYRSQPVVHHDGKAKVRRQIRRRRRCARVPARAALPTTSFSSTACCTTSTTDKSPPRSALRRPHDARSGRCRSHPRSGAPSRTWNRAVPRRHDRGNLVRPRLLAGPARRTAADPDVRALSSRARRPAAVEHVLRARHPARLVTRGPRCLSCGPRTRTSGGGRSRRRDRRCRVPVRRTPAASRSRATRRLRPAAPPRSRASAAMPRRPLRIKSGSLSSGTLTPQKISSTAIVRFAMIDVAHPQTDRAGEHPESRARERREDDEQRGCRNRGQGHAEPEQESAADEAVAAVTAALASTGSARPRKRAARSAGVASTADRVCVQRSPSIANPMPNRAASDADWMALPTTNQSSDSRCAVRPRYAKKMICVSLARAATSGYRPQAGIHENSARKLISTAEEEDAKPTFSCERERGAVAAPSRSRSGGAASAQRAPRTRRSSAETDEQRHRGRRRQAPSAGWLRIPQVGASVHAIGVNPPREQRERDEHPPLIVQIGYSSACEERVRRPVRGRASIASTRPSRPIERTATGDRERKEAAGVRCASADAEQEPSPQERRGDRSRRRSSAIVDRDRQLEHEDQSATAQPTSNSRDPVPALLLLIATPPALVAVVRPDPHHGRAECCP